MVYFKQILSYIATIPSGELNRNSIAKHIQLDYKTVQNYLHILEETGMVTPVTSARAGREVLKAREKVYLENTNLYTAIAEQTGYGIHGGVIREVFFVAMMKNIGKNIFYSNRCDFEIDGTIFEIGGRNESLRQIQADLDHAYLIKDDILYGNRYEIPLHMVGFLY